MGMLCDAIGSKRVLIFCHVACTAGLSLVLLLPQTDTAMIFALIIYDLCIPLSTMMFPLVSVDLFGIRSQHQYIGTIVAMATAGNIFSGMLANLVYDTLGSYRPVFLGSALLALAMIPLYGIVFALAKRDRKAFEKKSEVA
jgi:MFS family permease